jgi:hypothetical protein
MKRERCCLDMIRAFFQFLQNDKFDYVNDDVTFFLIPGLPCSNVSHDQSSCENNCIEMATLVHEEGWQMDLSTKDFSSESMEEIALH